LSTTVYTGVAGVSSAGSALCFFCPPPHAAKPIAKAKAATYVIFFIIQLFKKVFISIKIIPA
jgi:hypothetical protein